MMNSTCREGGGGARGSDGLNTKGMTKGIDATLPGQLLMENL